MKDKMLPHKYKHAKPGDIFGKLTVTAVVRGGGRGYATCKCACGTLEYTVRIDVLRIGHVKSCGCISKEMWTTHGLSKHPLYHTWHNMMRRCYRCSDDSNEKKNYTDRGITVCEKWHDVRKFIADMEPTFKPGLLLDREDNDKGYSPENCRWVDWSVQGSNKRNIKLITHNGESKTLCAWCKHYRIRYMTVVGRIVKQGMDPIVAFTTPVDPKSNNARPYSIRS